MVSQHISKEQQMVSQNMTQMGKWAQRIGGGALVLALVGLSTPATTSARIYEDETPEVIEVEDEAPPWTPPNWGGHTGGGGPSSGGLGDSGGGGGGGSAPSDDEISQQIMSDCAQFGGSLTTTEHYEFDTNGDVVDSWFRDECYVETQHGWMQIWYEPMNGSADPVEVCSGPPGQPGTCFEP
jgi:hypothetical protein